MIVVILHIEMCSLKEVVLVNFPYSSPLMNNETKPCVRQRLFVLVFNKQVGQQD